MPYDMSEVQRSFEANPEIYSLQGSTGMEMVAFPSKNLQWKGGFLFSNKLAMPAGGESSDYGGPSTPKEMNHVPTSSSSHDQFYTQHDLTGSTNETMAWNHHHQHDDDPSFRCVFPCQGNEGLSLSLRSSDHPFIVGLQSFDELGQQHHDYPRYFGPLVQGQSWIRDSKYLGPARDLLKEFCDIGTKEIDDCTSKLKLQKVSDHQDESGVLAKPSLDSLDLLGLQMRKTKLIQMIQEVDRRYKNYCNQMKAVVSSFEAVGGNGAATVYSAMASRVMSRHFRCLRDGIATQIKATKKAIEEKNGATTASAAAAKNKGETPRLRLLDQALRQQRAFQEMNMMETHPWRPQRGLPERSVSLLRAWLFEHFLHPYPSDVDKHILAHQTGLSRSQVSNWFINARVRLWKPMVEEMYTAEFKADLDGNEEDGFDPTVVRTGESGCLNPSSTEKITRDLQIEEQNPKFMEIDFSAYSDHGASGVSLTLGLQQHGGVRLAAFPRPPPYQMEECQTVPYSLLNSEGGQNLPYRDLMGPQLLHDLAG